MWNFSVEDTFSLAFLGAYRWVFYKQTSKISSWRIEEGMGLGMIVEI
jgi:hypothetical protein